MHWLYLLLALGALWLALTTPYGWLLFLALLAALALLVAWMRGWYLDRIGGQQRDESAIIDPLELRKLREQAAARKRELAAAQTQDPGPPAA